MTPFKKVHRIQLPAHRCAAPVITCSAIWRSLIPPALMLVLTAIWLLLVPRAEAIVTADAAGTHVKPAGTTDFIGPGLLPINYDGVVQILTDTQSPGGTIDFRGSGALISNRHVLTAAHVLGVTDPVSGVVLQQIDLFGSNNRVRFRVPGGDQFIPIAGISLHSDYRHSFLGSDIAIIELAQDAPASATEYAIYTDDDEVGHSLVKVGFGLSGWGGNATRTADNLRRAGLNSYDVDATFFQAGFTLLGAPVFADLPAGTGLVYDFDNGSTQRDALRAIGAANTGWGVDEVMSAGGDSGGPGFQWDSSDLEFKVAGITSFGETVPADLNYNPSALGIDQTFGEAAVDTRVSAFASYVEDVIAGEIPTLKARRLNNGGNWVANAGALRHHALRVADSTSGATTTLDIQTGGIIGTGSYLPAIPAVELSGLSELTISGGVVDGSLLGVLATEFSSVELRDGAVANLNAGRAAIALSGFSTAEIHGGVIGGDAGGVVLHDQAILTVTGGEITGVNGPGIGIGPGVDANVTITGGDISGSPEDLVNNSPMSRIRIVGRADSFNRPLGEISDESGSVTGLFADGTPFDLSFFRGGSGVIELVAAAGSLPGDFNQDGLVDAADYVVWRKTGGAHPAYDQWRANFGRTAGVEARTTTVPEPRAVVLCLLFLLGFTSCSVRRHQCSACSSGRCFLPPHP